MAKGKKILIVEDDSFLIKVYQSKFSSSGFDVSTASNGEEALQKVESEKPALVLLDLIMPSMSGFDVLKTLRTKYSAKELPILVLSNLGQDDDVAKAKEMGANEYIVKADTTLQTIIEKTAQYLT